MVTITSLNFISIWWVIRANYETSSSKSSAIIPYKVDTGSDGNIMPYYIFKILFSSKSKEQL